LKNFSEAGNIRFPRAESGIFFTAVIFFVHPRRLSGCTPTSKKEQGFTKRTALHRG
jgi:hypothetical protein